MNTKEWKLANRKRCRAHEAKYRVTRGYSKRVKASKVRRTTEWRERNREKSNAHQRVYYAVKSGKLFKPAICQFCGGGGRLHAHHEDYAEPLVVQWLCTACHRLIHAVRASGS